MFLTLVFVDVNVNLRVGQSIVFVSPRTCGTWLPVCTHWLPPCCFVWVSSVPDDRPLRTSLAAAVTCWAVLAAPVTEVLLSPSSRLSWRGNVLGVLFPFFPRRCEQVPVDLHVFDCHEFCWHQGLPLKWGAVWCSPGKLVLLCFGGC